jgi:chromosome segregation ATPase
MNRHQLLPESPDDKDTARFLRRFSELISVGQSASYLRHAAGLIEELVERIRQAEELHRQQQAIADNHLTMRRAAELELQSARAELFEFKAARSVEALKLNLARSGIDEEKQALSNRCEHAEARLAVVAEELRELRSRCDGLDDTHQLVALSTLLLLRAQFGALAKEFRRRGDTVSDVMCEIGIRTVDQAMAGETG